MNTNTLLLRQVNPLWVQQGHITSQVFKPTPKDRKQLSVYDADLISAQDAWKDYTNTRGFPSIGVMAVTVSECQDFSLSAKSDPQPSFPQHAVIDFEGLSENQ